MVYMLHLALLVINDIALILLKKLRDKYLESRCVSNCFDGTMSLCFKYIEGGRSAPASPPACQSQRTPALHHLQIARRERSLDPHAYTSAIAQDGGSARGY